MSKYLVITGGSRGIGEMTLAHFIEQGWEAINISRTPSKLPKVKNIAADLSSLDTLPSDIKTLNTLLKNAETISLVHNAGYYVRDNIAQANMENLQHTLSVNVLAPVALNKVIIPLMKPGSSIIYIGSTLSEKAVPNAASYVISKHAVVGLMRTTCQDLKDSMIRSVCICPGLVETDMVRENFDEQSLAQLVENKVLAKRLIQPSEIASVIYFTAITPVLNNTVIHANLGQIAD